jgi:hypothetical protein
MSNILKQQRLLTKRYFEITNNSLKISVKKPFKYYEEDFSFEEIGKKVFIKKSFNRYAVTGSVIALVGLLITAGGRLSGDKTISIEDILFYFILTIIASGILLVTALNTTNLMLVDKRYIAFFSKSTNKKEVTDFLALILAEQKKHMINKYARKEQFLPPERLMDQIIWLKDRDIISETEFENLKAELFPISSPNSIGFTFNTYDN